LVRHFHVLQFHALQLGPSISCRAISCPSFSAPPLAENAPQLATVPYIGVTTDDRFDFVSLGSHNGLNSPLTNLTRLSYTTRSWKTQARSFALLLYEIGEARIACLYLVNTTGGLLFTSILTFVAGQQQRPDDVFLL